MRVRTTWTFSEERVEAWPPRRRLSTSLVVRSTIAASSGAPRPSGSIRARLMYFTTIGLRSSMSRTAASRAATTSAGDPVCSTVASASTTCSTTRSSTARRSPSLVPK